VYQSQKQCERRTPGATYTLRISPRVAEELDREQFADAATDALGALRQRVGVDLPMAGLVVDADLPEGRAEFHVDGAEAWQANIPRASAFMPSASGTPGTGGDDDASEIVMPGIGAGHWQSLGALPLQDRSAANFDAAAGRDEDRAAASKSIAEVLGQATVANIGRWSSHAFGLQAADAWLSKLSSKGQDALVQQVRQTVLLTRLADIVRHLLSEDVTLAHPRLILEAVLEHAPKIDDTRQVADHVRLALSRPLSAQFASTDRKICALIVELDLEERLRDAVIEAPTGNRFALSFEEAQNLEAALRGWQAEVRRLKRPVVLATSFDVRRPLRQFVANRNLELAVVAFEEVAPDYRLDPISALSGAVLSGSSEVVAAE